MNFDHFLDSIENVPPELERNLTLIRELDERTMEVFGRIEECIVQYKLSKSRSDRKRIADDTSQLFGKIDSYAEDKEKLAHQSYELIDKNIKRLTYLGNHSIEIPAQDQADPSLTPPPKPIGFDMPPDPNEPLFCYCKNISHGEMIACENEECDTEWYHFECVGIKEPPKGKWYCGNCLPQVKAQYRKNVTKRRRR